MQIVSKGVLFSGDGNSSSNTFPSIVNLPSGRWLAGWRSAPSKQGMTGQRCLLSYSDDDGKSWSAPYSPFVPPQVDGKRGLFRTVHLTCLGDSKIIAVLSWVDYSEPELPFFNEQTEGLLDTKIFISFSDDDVISWSTPTIVDTSPFNQPTPTTGAILLLPNGELACQFELNKPYYSSDPWQHYPVLIFSKDTGKTWGEFAIPARDITNRIFYWDQRPAVIGNDKMLNVFWTYDTQRKEYLNIHSTESFDNGRTWTKPADIGFAGQPASPIRLPDGRIALIYIDRSDIPTIKMRLSGDDGCSWGKEEFVIYRYNVSQTYGGGQAMNETWNEMYKFSAGLPAGMLLPDGDIMVVFYAGEYADKTDIHWARIGL